ncbi:MAG TPA: ABC transporter permease, partial [Vicinamibacterales bacterium]
CAGWTSRALLLLVPAERRPLIGADIDVTILIFAAAVSAGTAVLFGLVPALLATRVEVLPALKQSASGTVTSDHPAHKIWSTSFVVVQVALSLVLLVGATLFIRTLTNLQRQALGVDEDKLLVFGVDPSQNGYAGDRLVALYGDLIRRLEVLPRVESVSAVRLRLFSGWVSSSSISIPGLAPKPSMNMQSNGVGAHFVKTFGIRMLAGRDIDWSDIDAKRRVAVVNEAMASYFFGDLNVIGRRFSFGETPDPDAEYEIIGVVSNAKYSQVRGTFPRTAYIPYTAMRTTLQGLYLHVRTAADPIDVAASVRGVVRSVDPSLAIVEMDTMRHQVADSLWQERLFAKLTSAFSALALTLACVGLYGTMSYGVGRRRSEIAVRMALGARYGQVLWMVLRQAVLLAVIGVVAGVPLTLLAGGYVSTLLYGLTPRDPATMAMTAAALIATASLAGYLPARRAARVDPAVALKQD